MPEAKVTSKGQVTIPVEIREALGLVDGVYTSWELKPDGVMVRPMQLRPLLTEEEVNEAVSSLSTAGDADLATADELLARLKQRRQRGR